MLVFGSVVDLSFGSFNVEGVDQGFLSKCGFVTEEVPLIALKFQGLTDFKMATGTTLMASSITVEGV